MDQNSWATALDRYWGDQQPGTHALLMLEQSLLRYVSAYVGESFDTTEQAQASFVNVVKNYLLGKSHRTWMAERYDRKQPPRFLLQIAIQIYAASKMQADENGLYSEQAYHPQLDNLLGERLSKRRFNMNEQADYHQQLWRVRLMEWVQSKQLRLTLPEDIPGRNRNHVGLPLSQMVLRASDIQRLPVFFSASGFKPGDYPNDNGSDGDQLASIRTALRLLRCDRSCFSGWAINAIGDEYKFDVAVHQINEALRNWDGRLILRNAGRRSQRKLKKSRWVWLDVRVVQRRLRAVGGVSSATAKALTPAELEWLFAGKETTTGDLLEFHDGFTLFVYKPEDAAFKQAEYVDAGRKGILLSGPGHFANWNRVLNCDAVASIEGLFSGENEGNWEWIAGLPAGCRVLMFQINDRLLAAELIPDAWRPFLRLPSARLSLSGGLRIGRGENFVAGAGPNLTISGNYSPTSIYVDGKQVRISGRVVQLDQFSQVGEHEIIARYDGKDITKLFRVSHPKNVVPTTPSRGWTFHEDRWPVWEAALKAGGENEAELNDHSARLFGIRASNLKIIEPSSTDSSDDRLIAITLLSGMPLIKCLDISFGHPLVRQLMMMQPIAEPDSIEVPR